MALLLSEDGKLVVRDGKLVTTTNAADCDCCTGSAGCCPNELIEDVSTTLLAELLADGIGCWTVGDTQDLPYDTVLGGQWLSIDNEGFMANIAWQGLVVRCITLNGVSALHCAWDQRGGCPIKDTSTGDPWDWTLVSGQCNPLEFIFEYQVDEDDGTGTGCSDCAGTIDFPGLTGLLRIKITIKP